jgi:hypothetical protein
VTAHAVSRAVAAVAAALLVAGPRAGGADGSRSPAALAELGDHTWLDLKPPPRTVYQSIVRTGVKPDAILTPAAVSGTGVRFTASEPVFRAEHVGFGLAAAGERHAAVIREVVDARTVTADVLRAFPGTAAIAARGWHLQPPPECERTIESGGPVNRSYSGIVLGDGRVMYWGGGHGTHPGNDIELYDIARNRWEVQAPPQCPEFPRLNWLGTGTFTNELAPARRLGAPWDFSSPDGEPYTAHNYQNQAYDPKRGRFVWVAGGGTWAYTWRTRVLRLLAGPSRPGRPSPVWMSGGGVAHDPDADRILAFLTSPQRGSGFTKRGVYALDLATDTWRFHGDYPAPIDGRQVFSAYNPHAREHAVLFWPVSTGAPQLWRYRAAGNDWTRVDSLPKDVIRQLPAFDYDTANRRMIFLRDDEPSVRLWAWEPVSDSWVELGTGRAAPGSGLPRRLDRSRFKYDPGTNVFILVSAVRTYCGVAGAKCGGESTTYAYRFRRAGGETSSRAAADVAPAAGGRQP